MQILYVARYDFSVLQTLYEVLFDFSLSSTLGLLRLDWCPTSDNSKPLSINPMYYNKTVEDTYKIQGIIYQIINFIKNLTVLN